MHGHAVHGVMSADRTLLATLYRNPGDDDEPAFVHVLDLQDGWSYCADLPARSAPARRAGRDRAHPERHGRWSPRPTANRLAEIHIDDVRTPV